MAASLPKKPAGDDELFIGPDVGDLHRLLELAVKTLGSCFSILGMIMAVIGLAWVAATFRTIDTPAVVRWFEEFSRRVFPHQEANGMLSLLWVVAPPVLFTVLVSGLLFAIGRGLRELSPRARLASLVLLVPACVPPLVLFFISARVGIDLIGALAVIMFLFVGSGVLALASSPSDLLFTPGYRALVRSQPGHRARVVGNAVIVLFWLDVFMIIVLIASGY